MLVQIIAAVLNRYYNFNNPNDLGYMYWYVGEVAIAVCVGNIPLCWPLIRQVFQAGSWFDSKESGETPPHHIPRSGPFRRRPKPPNSSIWLSTWGQTTWDKVDDVAEDQGRGRRRSQFDGKGGLGGETVCEAHGSEIELTPGWHGRANSSAVTTNGVGGAAGAESGSDDPETGVVVVKTVRISRG